MAGLRTRHIRRTLHTRHHPVSMESLKRRIPTGGEIWTADQEGTSVGTSAGAG